MDRIVEVLYRDLDRGDLRTVGFVGQGGVLVPSAVRAQRMDVCDAESLVAAVRAECPGVVLRVRTRPDIKPATLCAGGVEC